MLVYVMAGKGGVLKKVFYSFKSLAFFFIFPLDTLGIIPIISRMSSNYTIDSIKANLKTSNVWQLRTLLLIHSLQTESEKANGTTHNDNGVGFTGADAEILTSFADRVLDWNKGSNYRYPLSRRQMELLQKKILKYAGQALKVINGKIDAPELPKLRPMGGKPRGHRRTRTNYDAMWNVSGYYNDNDGNDIRDRD